MMRFVIALCPIMLLAFTSCRSVTGTGEASAYFKSWPKGQSPLEIGSKVAQHFADSPHLIPSARPAGIYHLSGSLHVVWRLDVRPNLTR